MAPARTDGHLVVGGMAHDFDAARRDLLALASVHDHLRIRCSSTFEEFGDGTAAQPPSFLITYTCNLEPSPAALARIRSFVESGGRWVALHATSSLLQWRSDGVACAGLENPFLALIGTAFQAHPPYGRFTITPTGTHPLIAGIAPFDVEDELYLAEVSSSATPLLVTRFSGSAPGFVRHDWAANASERPMMLLRPVGKGAILHFALGHRRGHYDAPHRTPWLERTEPGPWENPTYQLLLARALAWAARTDPTLEAA